jgi:hypothetical protein
MMSIDEIRAMAERQLANDMNAPVAVKEFPDGGIEVRLDMRYGFVIQLPLPHRPERNPGYCASEIQMLRESAIQSIRAQLDAWEKAHGQ